MFDTEKLVEELDAWEKVIKGNAHLIARALLVNGLGPLVLTADIVTDGEGEELYGVQWEALSSSVHSC